MDKDIIYSLGIIATFLLGVWNAYYTRTRSRKTSFINNVTSERVKWINELRNNLSKFLSNATYCSLTGTDDLEEFKSLKQNELREMERLSHLIQLQLNPEDDEEVEKLVLKAVRQAWNYKPRKLSITREELVQKSQTLLKNEWDKVKKEAKDGDLSESEGW